MRPVIPVLAARKSGRPSSTARSRAAARRCWRGPVELPNQASFVMFTSQSGRFFLVHQLARGKSPRSKSAPPKGGRPGASRVFGPLPNAKCPGTIWTENGTQLGGILTKRHQVPFVVGTLRLRPDRSARTYVLYGSPIRPQADTPHEDGFGRDSPHAKSSRAHSGSAAQQVRARRLGPHHDDWIGQGSAASGFGHTTHASGPDTGSNTPSPRWFDPICRLAARCLAPARHSRQGAAKAPAAARRCRPKDKPAGHERRPAPAIQRQPSVGMAASTTVSNVTPGEPRATPTGWMSTSPTGPGIAHTLPQGFQGKPVPMNCRARSASVHKPPNRMTRDASPRTARRAPGTGGRDEEGEEGRQAQGPRSGTSHQYRADSIRIASVIQ